MRWAAPWAAHTQYVHLLVSATVLPYSPLSGENCGRVACSAAGKLLRYSPAALVHSERLHAAVHGCPPSFPPQQNWLHDRYTCGLGVQM